MTHLCSATTVCIFSTRLAAVRGRTSALAMLEHVGINLLLLSASYQLQTYHGLPIIPDGTARASPAAHSTACSPAPSTRTSDCFPSSRPTGSDVAMCTPGTCNVPLPGTACTYNAALRSPCIGRSAPHRRIHLLPCSYGRWYMRQLGGRLALRDPGGNSRGLAVSSSPLTAGRGEWPELGDGGLRSVRSGWECSWAAR